MEPKFTKKEIHLPPGAKIGDKKDPGILDTPTKQFQRGIASFAPTESAAFSQAATQMGIDPTTGQQTGVASFEPFIQQAQATMGLGIPSLQQAQTQYDPATGNYTSIYESVSSRRNSTSFKTIR